MRFLGTIVSREDQGAPPPALMEAMGHFIGEAQEAGVVFDTGGLLPSATAIRVRLEGGQVDVVDGPFAEAKEVIGGYIIYQVSSREEALDWSRRFMEVHRQHWPEFEGTSELRQIFEPE